MRAFGPNIRGMCVLLLDSFCVSAVPGRLFADDDAKSEPAAKPAAAAKTEVPASETTQTAGTCKPILRATPVTPATSSEGASSTTSVSGSTAVTSGSESASVDSTIGPGAPDEINASLSAPNPNLAQMQESSQRPNKRRPPARRPPTVRNRSGAHFPQR